MGKNNALQIAALNITDHPITVARKTEVARFSIMTAEQAYNLTAIDPQLIALGKQKSSENNGRNWPIDTRFLQTREEPATAGI